MSTALDASVLVAGLSAWHTRHVECRRALAAALTAEQRPIVPAHALIEAYSVLTRLPPGYRIAPGDAQRLLAGALHGRARLVTERGASTWALLDDALERDVAGGAIYDLRILRAAHAAGATELVTLNPDDFRRLGLEGVEILEP